MEKQLISLDVISDPICPWCYIGKTRLTEALEAHGSNPFDIFWRPFQLNPEMPAEGMGRKEYLEAKFGKERAVSFYGQIEDTAKEAGLDVRFDKIERTPNTIDAHRVIRWARTEGVQNAVTDAMFKAYFEDGKDISDHAILAEIAGESGMDAGMVSRLLEGDGDVEEVRAEDKQAREMGVSGVPCFIVAGKYVINGAQPAEVWTKVLADIEEQLAADTNTETGH